MASSLTIPQHLLEKYSGKYEVNPKIIGWCKDNLEKPIQIRSSRSYNTHQTWYPQFYIVFGSSSDMTIFCMYWAERFTNQNAKF